MQNSGLMGGLYVITDWIMRLSVINMLWALSNLPLFFIVFLMAISPSTSAMIVLAIPLMLLLPLLFFPSTTAVFATVRDWIMKKEQTSLLKSYWRYIKSNYKNSFLSGIVLTFIWLVWIIDYYYFQSQYDLLGTVLIVIGLLLFVYTIIFFSLMVHYHMSKKELFKNAFFITIGRPLLVVIILLINFSIIYISSRFLVLLPFFAVSSASLLSFYPFYRFTLKVGKK